MAEDELWGRPRKTGIVFMGTLAIADRARRTSEVKV